LAGHLSTSIEEQILLTSNKIALLDTDFISKSLQITDGNESLLDVVLSLPGYHFFCHQCILDELKKYSVSAYEYVKRCIDGCLITRFSDADIIKMLAEERENRVAVNIYMSFLQSACSFLGSDLFSRYDINGDESSIDDFVEALHASDRKVERGAGLGEVKTFVLLQTIAFKTAAEQLYVFCSDDRDARKGAVNFHNAKCVNILSAFLWLRREKDWDGISAEPYIQSYVEFCRRYSQQTFYVLSSGSINVYLRVPCKQVLKEIFEDRFFLLNDGFLQYK
jgi:hypothetical protein